MEREKIPNKNVKNTAKNQNVNNSSVRGNSSSELLYTSDIMVNDAVMKNIRSIFADMKIYIDKEHLKTVIQLESQQSKISDLEEDISDLIKDKVEIETKLDSFTEKLEKSEEEIAKKLDTITGNHSSLEKQTLGVLSIVSDIESDIEKLVRKHSLIIDNLCPKEDNSSREMLKVYVKSLGIDLIDSDIEKMHLVGTETSNLPRPFLVTFTCYRTKVLIYSTWLQTRISEKAASVSPSRGQGINIKVVHNVDTNLLIE